MASRKYRILNCKSHYFLRHNKIFKKLLVQTEFISELAAFFTETTSLSVFLSRRKFNSGPDSVVYAAAHG